MKRFIIIVAFSLFLLPTVSAQIMRQLNVTVDILKDDSCNIELSFRFTDKIKEVKFLFSGEIHDLRTENGKCTVKEDIGRILQCEPPSPFMVGDITVKTNFRGTGLIEKRGNISYFSFDIPMVWDTDNVLVIVKLPDGMLLTEKVLLPISPSGADIRSDGRRILATWSLSNKRYGDVIPIRIYFETTSPERVIYLRYRYLAAIAIVVVISLIYIYKRVSKRTELVLSVLNENEKIVVDIIRKEGKEKVDQRKIVALSGFSKAKVSRIIDSLVGRGVIKVERIGRRNKITLKKIAFKE